AEDGSRMTPAPTPVYSAAAVVVAASRAKAAQAAVLQLHALHAKAATLPVELRDEAAIQEIVAGIAELKQQLDVLFGARISVGTGHSEVERGLRAAHRAARRARWRALAPSIAIAWILGMVAS